MLYAMMILLRNIFLPIIAVFILVMEADASYYKNNCEREKLGWNFYCDKKLENSKKKEKEETKEKPVEKQLTIGEIATQKIAEMRKKHQELLDIAIIFPTEENVKKYIAFNQKILNQSSYFSEVSERAIWKNPEIDYSLKRPVNAIGKQAWIDNRNKDIEQTINSLSDRYGVFFLYRSDCPYCHTYSPIIKNFSTRYDLNVIGISLNGIKLTEWPNTIIDQGQSKILDIKTVPATLLFDKQTSEIITVGFGVLTHEELKKRIYALTQIKPGETL